MTARHTPAALHRLLAASRLSLGFLAALCLLAFSVPSGAQERIDPTTPRSGSAPAAPAQVSPQAEEKLHNPYYKAPAWRLWTVDASPVAFTGRKSHKTPEVAQADFAPPAAKDRLYPDFSKPYGLAGLPSLVHAHIPPALAGWWDDCYMTLDGAHTNMPTTWSDGTGGSISIAGQYIHVNFGLTFNPAIRLGLGCNFTSQSFAGRGRHIMDDTASNQETERFFFFANCLRATPAHASYEDKKPERVHDAYDGLFGHSYQSLGQSGSETAACLKMMLAGGCLPRTTKDLLKLHGAYVIPLLTMFKAALPYADADGKSLPFENELRHRPVYSSLGAIQHTHYCPVNPYYHAYDDAAQVGRMLAWAREMKTPPPIAILKLLELTAEREGKTVALDPSGDASIKSLNKTIAIIWGQPGETLVARVSLADSYDLTGRKLTFEAHGVYPNQKNVKIQEEKEGVFRITVRHDPKLPKGRIPVVLLARNGTELPSNPVFVNFYWPQEGELANYTSEQPFPAGQKLHDVTQNLRPVVDLRAPYDTVFAVPGQTLRVPLDARDPEGYDIITYRWAGEAGRIQKGEYVLEVPADDPGRFYPVHLVFSDGTGGYTGRLLKVCVAPKTPALPEGWSFSTIGEPTSAGMVQFDGQNLALTGVGTEIRGKENTGSIVFRNLTGDFDLACRVSDLRVQGREKATARIGLIARDRLEEFGLHAGVFARGNLADRTPLTPCWISGQNNSSRGRIESDKTLATKADHLRLVRRGKILAAFASTDGKTWEQFCQESVNLASQCLVGVMVAIEGARRGQENPLAGGACAMLKPGTDVPVSVITSMSTKQPSSPNLTPGPVKVTLLAPGQIFTSPTPATAPATASAPAPAPGKVPAPATAGPEIRYTLDGSEPSDLSPRYSEPILIQKTGRTVLRARLCTAGQGGEVAVTIVNVE